MSLVIGSTNQTKIKAVKTIFPDCSLKAISVSSDVSPQPIGDEETLKGAMNRAKNAQLQNPQTFAIGLEGGVMYIQENIYLNSWGVIITPEGKLYTAAGARIPLPNEFKSKLNQQIELGKLMDDYTKRENIGKNEGAIGIFTSSYFTRVDLFAQVMLILKGQIEYDFKNEKNL